MTQAHFIEPDWPVPAGVRALSTLRTGGVSTGPWASLNLGTACGDDDAAIDRLARLVADADGLVFVACVALAGAVTVMLPAAVEPRAQLKSLNVTPPAGTAMFARLLALSCLDFRKMHFRKLFAEVFELMP